MSKGCGKDSREIVDNKIHKLKQVNKNFCQRLSDRFKILLIKNKSVWWMPWHKMAMKDAAWLR